MVAPEGYMTITEHTLKSKLSNFTQLVDYSCEVTAPSKNWNSKLAEEWAQQHSFAKKSTMDALEAVDFLRIKALGRGRVFDF